MNSSIVITLIICGTLLIVIPFLCQAIGTQQVVEVMIQLGKSANIKGSMPHYYSAGSMIIGAFMVGLGVYGGLKDKVHP